MTARADQVDQVAGPAGAAGGGGVPGGVGRARRRRRALVGAAALLLLTGGVSIAHGAADGSDGPGGAGQAGQHAGQQQSEQQTGQHAEQQGGQQAGHADHSAGKASGTGEAVGEAGPVGGASRSGGLWMRVDGVFSPPGSFVPSDALTYDTGLVPAAARIEVTQYADRSATRVSTRLRGLVPNRAYGMHVHTSPCAADPASAGPHYQHRPLPTADPVNEVWLDFRTDRNGDGTAEARHDWGFREGGARSVIVHDAQGGAGKRVACFTVPFSA